MKCEDFLAAFLAGETGPEVDAHLGSCAGCRADRPALDRLRETLAEPALWAEPPGDLRERAAADLTTREPRARRGGRLRLAAIAALVVLLAGVGTWWWLDSRPRPPDWEVTLVGTELAPRATGVVLGWETPHGTAIWLEVTGLDPAPEGHFYELWMVGEKGFVSAGSFRAAPGFELWAGVRLEDYPRLGITLEPDDGNPDRSGVKVMGSTAGE